MFTQKGILNRARLIAQRVISRVVAPLKGEYTLVFPLSQRFYSPWEGTKFKVEVVLPVQRHTLLTPDRIYTLKMLASHGLLRQGDFAECGAYRGGGTLTMAMAMAMGASADDLSSRRLFSFDTFEGMPDTSGSDAEVHSKGDFGDVVWNEVVELLLPYPFVELRRGLMPNTFTGLESRRFSFVHIDVDLYESTCACLEFFYPRMVQGGTFLFDDYGIRIYKNAQRKAVDEFFASKNEKPISLYNGQTILFKA